MRVAIDTSPLLQTRAGTARYLRGLLRELHQRRDVEVTTRSFGRGDRLSTLGRDSVWYPFALGRERRADVLHCPTYRGPVRPRLPVVVTVHDLAVLRHPGAFNRWTRTYSPRVVPHVLRAARRVIAVSDFTRRELAVLRHPGAFNRWTRTYSPRVVPHVLRAARRVIAVSDFTRRELVELLDVPEAKIRVVPNAVEDEFTRDGPAADGEYVLAVGTLEPRKNLQRLVEAARRADVELRVVGARGWGGVEVGGNGVHWLGEVSDAELARLYRGALCVAYPSLYEGFGIPVLEAMACGVPVVTTRGTAMEEVADGAAVLVDARDSAEIAAGFERAASERDQLVARGLERARAFRWDTIAEATVAVYREAAG